MNSAQMIIPYIEEIVFIGGFFCGMIVTFLAVLVFRQR